MSRSEKVVVLLPAVCVAIDYRTGRTRLHTGRPDALPADAVVVDHQEEAPSWGTTEVSAVLMPSPTAPWAWRLIALPALLATAAAGAAGPRSGKFHRLIRLACAGRSLPEAGELEVRNAVRAVRWASRAMPARWACLEQSTAAALLLAAIGRRAEWRHGVAGDPVRLHAWIVDQQGRSVEEPPDTALYGVTYTPDGPGPARRGRGRSTT
ncbi:lasso peptide biosynthesis B2 protein [Streptomyces sp. 130]|uniref:lasso peptide biosynthesis B2 protein n=1 Tax=Streptomyces sp. 130 TaxID=2591006 RepID=UPI00117D99C0|nr:lasso peptide biosynthesis B2 protein [Streptomyces sp. 130]TRV75609.1 lasso peptide biosynthesis B2 protein [Streptomyces sp. 130]